MLNSPAAPYPVIPTYKPSKTARRQPRFYIMPTIALTESKHFARISRLHRPRPRSAGASSRPTRNENITELVRFFQKEEEEEENPRPVVNIQHNNNNNMDLFKAGQRRLRTLGQTKSERSLDKGTDTSGLSEKRKAQHQHLIALQREGLLPGLGDLPDSSRPSRTKQDVEAIGRPWLDDTLVSIASDGTRSTSDLHGLRNESLSLGDLADLVEFSVSFPELYPQESSPPPYQAQAQTQSQSESEPQSQLHSPSQSQSFSLNGAAVTDHRNHRESSNANGDGRETQSCDLRVEGANPALNKQAHQLRGAAAVSSSKLTHDGSNNSNSNSKLDLDQKDGDSCCGSNHTSCHCEDAKSLAVLLRATERLEVEKKRISSIASSSSSSFPTAPTATTSVSVRKPNTQPHSLNQGVTDTPLLVRKSTDGKDDGPETATKISAKSPARSASEQLLCPLPQTEVGLSKALNAGPIPLKLVAECMPPVVSKATSSQPLRSSAAPRSQSHLNGEFTIFQPYSASIGPTSANFPRPGAHLSPIPIQSRRARSLTPDVASDKQRKGRKRTKRSPLLMVADAAPMPPPAKPLPSIPHSTAGDKPARKDRNMTVTLQPASAFEHRDHDRDSPILGMHNNKLRLRRSWVGARPSSRYSNKSNDAFDVAYNVSDDLSSRTASPVYARPESRRGRADHVHAIRMRDIGATKKKEDSTVNPNPHLKSETPSEKHRDPVDIQLPSPKQNLHKSTSRKNRISAVPEIPLPQDPPINPQGTPNQRRRTSTSSVPGSGSTTNGYEGSLSRSVSVTSGSIDSTSVRHRNNNRGYIPRDPSKILANQWTQLDSPLLPYSDDEQHRPQTRYSKNEPSMNDRIKQSPVGKQRTIHSQGRMSQFSEMPQRASLAGEPQMNYMRLVYHLESRVATLERQNKMLQAALLAALDVGVSHDADSVHSRSTSPMQNSVRIPTISEMSMPSPSSIGIGNTRQMQEKTTQRHHQTRNVYTQDDTSQESRGSFETTSSHSDSSLRAVEGMLSDVGLGGRSTVKSRQ